MILLTYQSQIVLDILKSKKIYKAKPSISFKGEYAALIEMLDLNCECPIFAVVKSRRQKTSGRVSAAVLLTLDVPDDKIKYTDFNTWADFMYGFTFSKPNNYKKLLPSCEELPQRKYDEIMSDIINHKPQSYYAFPQAILEEIKPEWLKSYKVLKASDRNINFKEKIGNIFRK